ncbi:MAG: flagellin [Phycisphaeraceae bacterium]|nr:flagellin [Phycisphaeraceae bacterium]
MSRINTNVGSMLAQRILRNQNFDLSKTMERLSTGLAINRGADNPAGLIASEKLRAEKAAITSAIGNAERADQVVNIAEGGLQEINAMLIELQGLVTETANTAGLSREEREANQLQIDSILQTIDRVASTTNFQGTRLLNGSFDFTTSGVSSSVRDFKIHSAKLLHDESRPVQVLVTASAQHGALFLSAGAGALNLSSPGAVFSFDLGGKEGSRVFSFASGTALSSIATNVNSFRSVTGVSAFASGNYLGFRSAELGSDHFVSFRMIEQGGQAGGVFHASASDTAMVNASSVRTLSSLAGGTETIRDMGQDVRAIINGMTATGRGATASVNTDFLDLRLTLTDAGAQSLSSIDAMTITGGGAVFNLGPKVNILNQVSIGVGNIAIRHLGGHDVGGFLNDLGAGYKANVVDGDLEAAQRIVERSIDLVSNLRGRLGAFQKNTVGATIRSLGVSLENTSAAESSIRDTDFAAETAKLTRGQILVQAATSMLGISNNSPQSVLQLLG